LKTKSEKEAKGSETEAKRKRIGLEGIAGIGGIAGIEGIEGMLKECWRNAEGMLKEG
jgi:hypothetical protein